MNEINNKEKYNIDKIELTFHQTHCSGFLKSFLIFLFMLNDFEMFGDRIPDIIFRTTQCKFLPPKDPKCLI